MKYQRLNIKNQIKGFTLIELMIVITVIAILATIVLFGLGRVQAGARDTERQATARAMQACLQRFYGDNSSSYPQTFNALGSYFTGFSDPGCGGGRQPVAILGAASNALVPGNCNNAVTYSYSPAANGSGYTLILVKEGGGSNLFISPQ